MSSTPNDDDDDDASTTRCKTLTTATPPYLPPSLLSTRLNWDVYLSFRAVDTRHTITQSLFSALQSNGLRVFIDGDNVGVEVEEAIVDSAIAVAIISPRYGDSYSCLDELCKLFESQKRVIPVFYQIEPSDIRWQEGGFGDRFRSMVEEYNSGQPEPDAVEKWKKALTDAANISGYPCRSESDDPEVIQRIVKQVVGVLKNTPEYVAKITVGLDSRVNQVVEKLDIHSAGVQFLGIHGTPGIGKTTLAKAAFNKLTVHFKRRCFVSNVREQLGHQGGVLSVQNKILQDLSLRGAGLAEQESLARKSIRVLINENRVLVVLDDVSDANQLERLGIVREWLEEGSRIIITSRDKGAFRFFGDHDQLHEAKKLCKSESLELFSIHALGRREPTKEFLSISKKIVDLTDGLPLALEVFGSSLVKKTMSEWEDSLLKLSDTRPNKLQGVMKISYDALDAPDKTAFLDISCLLLQMKMKREDVVDILTGCGLKGELAIRNLVTKSLMKISVFNELWMHDQIRDMGKQIVMDENFDEIGKWSRLWDSGDIRHVLRHKKATGAIRGIVLDIKKPSNEVTVEERKWFAFRSNPSIKTAFNYLSEKFMNFRKEEADETDNGILYTKSFGKMDNLKLIQINYSHLRGNMKYMPSKLRCLQWKGCSQRTLSKNMPAELRVLDVSGSSIQQLWSSGSPCWGIQRLWPLSLPCCFSNKVARNLVVLNLSYNRHLTALPDMSNHRHLEKLALERCDGLTKIHNSLGKMSSLVHLNLQQCSNLVDFPSDITGMKGLRELNLSNCPKFRKLPDDVRSLKSLTLLLLDGTAIVDLPKYLFHLTQLEVLSLNRCNLIKELPSWIGSLSSLKDLSLNQTKLKLLPETIGSLSSLEKLSLVHCSSLDTLPDSVRNLKSLVELHLSGTSFRQLPPSICSLTYLKVLDAAYCRSLSVLPVSIGGLASVTDLVLTNTAITHLPDEICSLTFLRKLEMIDCKSLAILPESIGKLAYLETLLMIGAAIKQLPESIGGLKNLTHLNLNKCSELDRLPESFGMLDGLRSLHILMMEDTAVTFLPKSFGNLEGLMVLKMKKAVNTPTRDGSASAVSESTHENLHGITDVLPASFSKLSCLEEFDARGCNISGQIRDDFVMLSKLEILDLGINSFHSLPSTLEGLSFLKNLSLRHCENLRSIPRLPSTLELLLCADCYALESISDLSNLHRLQELRLANCDKLVDVPGLECLKSLRRLFMCCCTASASAVKSRLSRVTLKNLNNLSIPGDDIPDWFSQETTVIFTPRPNTALKNIIIAVVISVNLQMLDKASAEMPNIVCIQAHIRRQNRPVHTTTLILAGVPNKVEDQVYLCRFKDYNALVSMLREGDSIQIIQIRHFATGVELKKRGMFLVFENDDDYDGVEDSLPVEQQSVTQRLACYFRSL